ncbi:FAST kinase domain-containing protein 1, mitochondrial [Lycorma delicatula]|uniref:FAST kinase domain-containing protein 1, mitochondrial n=1 Tax=Lycorma delicatula TaxID=130591 RepID=UPI003F515A56
MIFKFFNKVLNKHSHLQRVVACFRIYCSVNVSDYSKLRLFEKKYLVCTSTVLLKRNALTHVQPSNSTLLLKEKLNRNFSSVDEDDFLNVDELEEKLTSAKLRNFLYPESDDPVIVKLKESTTVQQVFEILEEYADMFTSEWCCQAIVVLWDLQKLCRKYDRFGEVYSPKSDLLISYIDQLINHNTFLRLVDLVNKHHNEMSPDGLACCTLYLTRLGLEQSNNVIKNLIFRIDSLIERTKPGEFPLTALSRYSVLLGSGPKYNLELRNKLALSKVLPHLEFWLDSCTAIDNYSLLTICVDSLNSVMTLPVFEKYHNVTNHFIELNQLKKVDDVSTLVKAISLFSYYYTLSVLDVKNLNYTCVKLMKLISGNVNKISHLNQLFRLQKAFLYLMEPASLADELKDCCSRWVETSELSEKELSDINPELLFCLIMNTSPYKQHRYSETVIQLINKTDKLHELYILSTTQLMPLINMYKHIWPKILHKLIDSPHLRSLSTLLFLSARYMDLSVIYRDKRLEEKFVEWLIAELYNTSALFEPQKLSQIAAFILSFCEHIKDDKAIMESLFHHVISNSDQFSCFDCLTMSRAFRIVLMNSSASSHLLHYFVKLDMALITRTLQLLDDNPSGLSLNELNMLLRSHINRKGACDSVVFQKLQDRFKFIKEDEISSKSLRNTIYNMNLLNLLIPDLLDKFCDYVISHKDIVVGSTVSKLLNSLYILGHVPKNESFCKFAASIVLRDADYLSGLVLLQAALSLSSYNSLSNDIIKYIFTIEFLDQLDYEIRHGYLKKAYPARIKQTLMELNRSVCLDYPEADVPWFHAKYCQQEATVYPKVRTQFHHDIYETLVALLKDHKLIQRNVQSSYGHNIDFQLCFDNNYNLVPHKREIDEYSKLAIILTTEADFTMGVRRLKGPLQMKKRHLEILGYRVIMIGKTVWNSMYMTEPKAKQNYLCDLIKNSNVNQT